MKKKILLLLVAALAISQQAFAYEIEYTNNAFDFDVQLQSDETTKRPTLQMLSEDKTRVVYMAEGEGILNKDYTYTLSFDHFTVPKTLETGKYILRVGGKGLETKETKIDFVNSLDKSNALNELDAAEDKCAVIINRAAWLGIDATPLAGLNGAWKSVVNADLANASFKNDGTQEAVDEKYTLFSDVYGKSIEKAVIAGSDKADDVLNMIEASKSLGLNKESFYNKLTDKSAVAKMLAEKKKSTDISDADIVKEFDGAVLVAVIKQLDWGNAKSAMEYYNASGVINVSFTAFASLSQTNQANVYKDLKNSNISDYSSVPNEFTRLVGKYKLSSNSTSGGSGGGGGGGSVGAAVVTAPSPTTSPEEKAAQSGNTVVKPNDTPVSFTDMESFSWAVPAVNVLKDRGVVDGDGTGRFYPGNAVKREEFAKIAVMAFNLLTSGAEAGFVDVPSDSWYAPYVASAKVCGIVTGINDDEFGSGTEITRQDMAVILKRIYDMADMKANTSTADFKDFAQVADYAKDAINVLYNAGILNGDDNENFNPKNKVTKAESAKAVYELLRVIEGE